MYSVTIAKYKKKALRHFLMATRQIIPRLWRSNETPTRLQWIEALDSIKHMEELKASDEGRYEQFNNIWSVWIDYRHIPALRNWLSTDPQI
ncbi:hypothetical protein GDO81_021894 [Engystomops pustulosus]|uniref:Uncharacterized protein n=1 Tax=Engystomops pustulosus TaxID=76066 RepID=A0AAV6ZPP6_ENGPU|nr:hypothetical protein GDO81_021894 [Engystomops pustulosus]